jgi:hypothetical protein
VMRTAADARSRWSEEERRRVTSIARGGCEETACRGEAGIRFGGLDMCLEQGGDTVWKRSGGDAVRGKGSRGRGG